MRSLTGVEPHRKKPEIRTARRRILGGRRGGKRGRQAGEEAIRPHWAASRRLALLERDAAKLRKMRSCGGEEREEGSGKRVAGRLWVAHWARGAVQREARRAAPPAAA